MTVLGGLDADAALWSGWDDLSGSGEWTGGGVAASGFGGPLLHGEVLL